MRVDTQTILTIQNHVITKNHRMSITHAEKRAWILRIRDVKETDKGWYMCQINTDPMKSQVGYLDVVGKYKLNITILIIQIENLLIILDVVALSIKIVLVKIDLLR